MSHDIKTTLQKIITQEVITDQTQLMATLKAAGCVLSQATLSRWLNRLGIQKQHGVYIWPKNFFDDVQGKSYSKMPVEINLAPPNLLILKTLPGNAPAIAAQLDHWIKVEAVRIADLIAGTIAGDDTVFVAIKSGDLEELKKIFKEIFNKNNV